MRTVVISQARMTSTRLPGKVLLPLANHSVLGLHLERLRLSGFPAVVATTDRPVDAPIIDVARRMGVAVHCGDELDVLSRFADAAVAHEADVVVRVTSDCPLVDGAVVARAVEFWRRQGDSAVYVSNTVRRTWPRGFDVEVFSTDLLLRAHKRAVEPHHREHVTPYLYDGTDESVTVHQLTRTRDGAENLRVTLDTEDDLEMLRQLVEHIDAVGSSAEDVIAALREHTTIAAMNAHVVQKVLPESRP